VRTFLLALLAIASPATAATVYDVGPGQPYAAIGDVPWETLTAGDVVQIHWRSTPYKEKWVLARQGTAAAPIVVRGIPGPGGERPVIDGNGATTRLALDYASEGRGVIKIGSSSIPPDTIPKWIVVEGLHVTGARSGRSFTDDGGATQTYSANASTIYIEKGESITVRDCELTDSGNGFFVASSDALASRNILVEGCFIHDNGNVGSIFEHNLYVAGIGMTFQHNRLGPLLPGASGNNLKDRSAGLVVRYNWIEGGNRQLDLVDGEDSALIRSDPRYGQTHVYGNVLIEPDAAGNRQLIHYGGDSGTTANYRKGTLWLYGNTFISRRTDANRTTLVRLSTNSETCDARDNIVSLPAAAGTSLSLMDTDGVLRFSHNWMEPGYRVSFGTFSGTVSDDGSSVTGTNPGFVDEAAQDFHLAAGSTCRDAGTPLDPAVLPEHTLMEEYLVHQSATARPDDGALDLGAYEFCSASAPGTVSGLSFDADRQTLRWNAASHAQTYDVLRGSLNVLRESSGDFDAASDACPGDDLAGTSLTDATAPTQGTATFWLVRGVGCGGLWGAWDDGSLRQVSPRDAGVCP